MVNLESGSLIGCPQMENGNFAFDEGAHNGTVYNHYTLIRSETRRRVSHMDLYSAAHGNAPLPGTFLMTVLSMVLRLQTVSLIECMYYPPLRQAPAFGRVKELR